MTPIDTATNTAGLPITVGTEPIGVAVTPDQAPTAAFTRHRGDPGQPDHLQRLGLVLAGGFDRLLRLELR